MRKNQTFRLRDAASAEPGGAQTSRSRSCVPSLGPRSQAPGPFRAFTLLELLVGMAVMSVVLVVLLQITAGVLQTSRFSHQRMNAAQKARAVLDTLGSDLAHYMNERGRTVFARQTTWGAQNIELAFLTQGRGPTKDKAGQPVPTPRLLAVDYQLDEGAVVRSCAPVAWNSLNLLQEVISAADSDLSSVLASGVLRFEAVAVLDDGTTVPLYIPGPPPWLSATVDGQTIPDPDPDPDPDFYALGDLSPSFEATRGVRAIVVAVATLDDQALALLPDGGKALAQALPAPTAGQTPVEVWNRTLTNGNLNSYPRPVIAGLHFLQSTYALK